MTVTKLLMLLNWFASRQV